VRASFGSVSVRRSEAALVHESVASIVVGGYLGAGKTTLVNHALATAGTRRIGVIVNDFGRLNVDAALLQTSDTIELANGCVCCTLADGLPTAFERLLSRTPALDAIVVEASGVADPRKIAGYARLAGLKTPHVVVVVDAQAILALQRDRFVAKEIDRQIRSAGLLVVNKRDTIDDATAAAIERRLHELAPAAQIVEATRGAVDWTVLLAGDAPTLQLESHDDAVHDAGVYDSWSLDLSAPIEREALERFADAISLHALRAKGVLALRGDDAVRYVWQWTPFERTLEPQAERGNGFPQSSIVVVGRAENGLASFCDGLARTYLLEDPS
jgi:G3E family GTPase